VEVDIATFNILRAAKDNAPPLNKDQRDNYINIYKDNTDEQSNYLFSYPTSLNNSNISEAVTDDDPLLLS